MSYNKNNWIINKKKVALYCFQDKKKEELIDDLICEDAVNMLVSELELIKVGLSSQVNKTDPGLVLALHFFTACLMVKTGLAQQKSGIVQSESLEGMSVSYGGESTNTGVKAPIPKDFCAMAQDQLTRWSIQNKLHSRNIKIAVRNYRNDLFSDTHNKYTDDFKHGE